MVEEKTIKSASSKSMDSAYFDENIVDFSEKKMKAYSSSKHFVAREGL